MCARIIFLVVVCLAFECLAGVAPKPIPSIEGCSGCAWSVVPGSYEPMLECKCAENQILRMDHDFVARVLSKCSGTVIFVDGELACR